MTTENEILKAKCDEKCSGEKRIPDSYFCCSGNSFTATRAGVRVASHGARSLRPRSPDAAAPWLAGEPSLARAAGAPAPPGPAAGARPGPAPLPRPARRPPIQAEHHFLPFSARPTLQEHVAWPQKKRGLRARACVRSRT